MEAQGHQNLPTKQIRQVARANGSTLDDNLRPHRRKLKLKDKVSLSSPDNKTLHWILHIAGPLQINALGQLDLAGQASLVLPRESAS